MNTFKRLSSGIMANIEWMVGQLENHEGLVEATLKEVNQSAAKAKVQLSRVRQDGQNMKKKLIELRNAEELWMERAKKNSYPKALVEHILAAMSTFASCRNADNQPEAMLAQQVVEELPK